MVEECVGFFANVERSVNVSPHAARICCRV